MQHEALESVLLFRSALNNYYVAITMHRHETSHEQLISIFLHFETMSGVGNVANPEAMCKTL